ncbi:MAG: Imm50 family immunity protein [Aminipila sp.]
MDKELIDGYEEIENVCGYWPSFHDDTIEKIEISEDGIMLIISFEKPPNNISADVTIKLSFKEVEAFSLSGQILGCAGIILIWRLIE